MHALRVGSACCVASDSKPYSQAGCSLGVQNLSFGRPGASTLAPWEQFCKLLGTPWGTMGAVGVRIQMVNGSEMILGSF